MPLRFSSLMDIDKLIPIAFWMMLGIGFSSLMDIDKLILSFIVVYQVGVLVL